MVVARGLGLRCAITDLSTDPGAHSLDDAQARRLRLEEDMRRWAKDGIDIVQLREKRLDAGEVLSLAKRALEVIQSTPGCRTRLLVNGRTDLAAAAGAHGVQLTAQAGELFPEQVRAVYRGAGLMACTVGVSCHTVTEVRQARELGANLVLFGPVFEKRVAGQVVTAGLGLEILAEACTAAGEIPVLALGGVTHENASACLAAGAAGIAGIRLFA